MNAAHRWLPLVLLAALTACGGGGGSGTVSSAPPPTSGITFSGTVTSGSQPVSGSSVSVWAANPTSGAPATRLASAATDSNGQFTFSFTSAPANGQVVYLVAQGGNAGSGSNSAIALMTVAGAYCTAGQSSCTFPASIMLNELTTVASVYSLAAFMQLSGSSVNVSGSSPGLNNAALTFASLMNAATGAEIFQDATACSGNGEPDNCSALRKLNTLGNALAACVNSTGAGSSACQALFQQTGSAADTLQAAFNIATQFTVRNDGAGLFNLAGSAAVYAPVLSAAPGDWTLAVSYTGGGLYQPAGIAIDGAGHVWVADYQQPGGAVSEFATDGTPLSGSSGFTGGGLMGSFGIALGAQGNAWVANWNGGNGTSVSELAADGSVLSGTHGFTGGGLLGPIALAVAPDGSVWSANSGNASVTKVNMAGQASGPYSGGGLGYPIAIAVDTLGDVWVANQGNSSVSEFDANGTAISGSAGYSSGGVNAPAGLALDPAGNVWVSDYYMNAVSELAGGNTPPASCPQTPGPGDSGCALSPAGGFSGGGLDAPNALAVDSAGHVFVDNFHGGSITELDTAGQSWSPAVGYSDASLVLPAGMAIDPSGNLWVADFGDDLLTKFIGLAAPVKTPLIGLPAAP